MRGPGPDQSYPPISDYAAIGNLQACALVSREGSIDWLCLPNISDPPLFAGLLDHLAGGHFRIHAGGKAVTRRSFEAGTPVLRTRFDAQDGSFTVTDFIHSPVKGLAGRIEPERQLIRLVEATEGRPVVRLDCQPRPPTRKRPKLQTRGKMGWACQYGADVVLLQTDIANAEVTNGGLTANERLEAGATRQASLSFCRRDAGVIPPLGAENLEKLETTIDWWRRWTERITYRGPFREAVERSLIVLRLLTSGETGAVAAAGTTSLPEWIGGSRNWDYRYCWMRDAHLVLAAFMQAGFDFEAKHYLHWLMHATQRDQPGLRPLYDIHGRSDLKEKVVSGLEGYRRSAPVRTGNNAKDQLQLDSYGSVVLAAREFVANGGEFDASEASRLRGFGRTVCEMWDRPDNGIWEIRGRRMHHVYSKAMCWAALDGLLEIDRTVPLLHDRLRFEEERRRIKDAVLEHGWNAQRGAFTGAFGHEHLDASVLLLPRIGLIAADDPRMCSTFDRIEDELAQGPFVWRYARGVDGMEEPEGSFLACGFWACEYLALRGEKAAARRRIAALLEAANDLWLMAEEYDPASRTMLGNFPQGLSHAAFVDAAYAAGEGEA